MYIISAFSSRESLCRFTLLTSTQCRLFESMQLCLRHYEGGLLKVNHWIVTPQQHRFASGLHFFNRRGATVTLQQLAPARLMHAPGTKPLSGVSNGSVWVLGGKGAKQLRSLCGFGSGAHWNCLRRFLICEKFIVMNRWQLESTFKKKRRA